MYKTKVDVAHLLEYKIEDSCDEKLLKLIANKIDHETKIKAVKQAKTAISTGHR